VYSKAVGLTEIVGALIFIEFLPSSLQTLLRGADGRGSKGGRPKAVYAEKSGSAGLGSDEAKMVTQGELKAYTRVGDVLPDRELIKGVRMRATGTL